MRTVLPIVLAAILLAVAAGFVYLGARPPRPHVHAVDRVLPNDQFQTH